MIHSVDSFKLAEEIDRRAERHGMKMDVLVQVNAAKEESKFGITAEETGKLIQISWIAARISNQRIDVHRTF